MSSDLKELKERVDKRLKALLEERKTTPNASTYQPTDEKKAKAVIGYEISRPTAEDVQAETDAMTADDYDDWIADAIRARTDSRIQLDHNGQSVEHPTARLLRIGIESCKVGKPSLLFLEILELMAQGAETHDVLHIVFPEIFPKKISKKAMKAADNMASIAAEFQTFVKTHSSAGQPFSEVKAAFKNHMQMQPTPVHPKTVDRALDLHGKNWEANPGPKSKSRKVGF